MHLLVHTYYFVLVLCCATTEELSNSDDSLSFQNIEEPLDKNIQAKELEQPGISVTDAEQGPNKVTRDEVSYNVSELGTMGSDEPVSLNTTVINDNTTGVAIIGTDDGNTTSILVACNPGQVMEQPSVELVNNTRLVSILVTEPNITNRRTPADCVVLLFYARFCPFSSMAAPHFNALPRAFPRIQMAAVDAMKHHSFNTQYGIVGVPTLMIFHNGRPAAKFNESEYTLEMFSKFITKYTGMEPEGKLFVMSADFGGPVSSVPTKEVDYFLVLSWLFIVVCGVYFFSKSSWWTWIVENVQNTWREAEAQHEHVE